MSSGLAQLTRPQHSSAVTRHALLVLAFSGLLAIAILPLFMMEYPTLDDYFHHLSRVYIVSQGASGALGQFYAIDWRLVPNLAMDLIVPPLTALMPIQDAGRLFVGLSLVLMASGTLALYAALHRRLAWWPFLVFLVLWNRVFLYGFSNYLFTLGLSLWALAAWVHWYDRRAWFRVPSFAVVALVLFIFHLYAFGIYALGVLGYQLARTDWSRESRTRAVIAWAVAGTQFVVPALLFLLQSPTSGYASAFEYPEDLLHHKLRGFHHLFLNYDLWFDRLTFVVLAGAFLLALVTRRIVLHPHVRWILALLLIAYLLMPQILFDTGAADYRLPVGFVFILIAGTTVRAVSLARARLIAAALLALFLVRMGLVIERWASYDHIYQDFRHAIAGLPEGGTMVTVATRMPDYHHEFNMPQLMYLSAIAIIEKSFFDPSFATFAHPGKQPVTIKPPYHRWVDELDARLETLTDTRRFARTPTLAMLLAPSHDGDDPRPLLERFDYVLVLYATEDANPAPALLDPLYVGQRFQLYRVKRAEATAAAGQPAGRRSPAALRRGAPA